MTKQTQINRRAQRTFVRANRYTASAILTDDTQQRATRTVRNGGTLSARRIA